MSDKLHNYYEKRRALWLRLAEIEKDKDIKEYILFLRAHEVTSAKWNENSLISYRLNLKKYNKIGKDRLSKLYEEFDRIWQEEQQ